MNHGTTTAYQYGCRCRECKAARARYQREVVNARAAERVEINGRMVHPTASHGKYSTYCNYKCRCEPCTTAWSEYCVDQWRRRCAKSFEHEGRRIVPDAPHGTLGGYKNYHCQCEDCVAAYGVAQGIKNPGRRMFDDGTHCGNGHEYTPENTRNVYAPDGSLRRRKCRTCERDSTRARRAKQKANSKETAA